jgi:hypothetical protein
MASTKRTLDASNYDTDKAAHTHYLRNYEEYFRPLLDKDVRLLELGVLKGGSLLLWRDYFERGVIAGLDLNPAQIEDPTGRMRLYNSRLGRLPLVGRLASNAKRTLQHGLYNSHNYGMVGFVKELVDELGASDITHPKFGIAPPRTSRFREMKLSQSHLIVVKA